MLGLLQTWKAALAVKPGPAVLYLSPLGRVTGSLIDSLEYFLGLHAAGIKANLVYMGKNKHLALELLKDRYNLAFDPSPYIFFPPRRWQLNDLRFTQVIAPYNTYRRVYRWIHAEETYVLPSMWLRTDSRWRWSFPKARNSRVFYLLDPSQHSYDVPLRLDYEKKLYLDGLKRPLVSSKNLLVNCQPAHKRHQPDQIHDALKHCGPHEKVLVLAQPNHASEYRKAGFEVLSPPVSGFFERFNQYLYLTSLNGYDENPRLMIESAFLGKEIIYPDVHLQECAASRKYARLQDGVDHFRLTPEDPLFQRFS